MYVDAKASPLAPAPTEGRRFRAIASNTMARILLQQEGVLVNATNDIGESALHWCHSADTVRLLVEHGADLEQCDKSGHTPLMKACSRVADKNPCRADVIFALLEAGANIQAGLAANAVSICWDNLGNDIVEVLLKTRRYDLYIPSTACSPLPWLNLSRDCGNPAVLVPLNDLPQAGQLTDWVIKARGDGDKETLKKHIRTFTAMRTDVYNHREFRQTRLLEYVKPMIVQAHVNLTRCKVWMLLAHSLPDPSGNDSHDGSGRSSHVSETLKRSSRVEECFSMSVDELHGQLAPLIREAAVLRAVALENRGRGDSCVDELALVGLVESIQGEVKAITLIAAGTALTPIQNIFCSSLPVAEGEEKIEATAVGEMLTTTTMNALGPGNDWASVMAGLARVFRTQDSDDLDSLTPDLVIRLVNRLLKKCCTDFTTHPKFLELKLDDLRYAVRKIQGRLRAARIHATDKLRENAEAAKKTFAIKSGDNQQQRLKKNEERQEFIKKKRASWERWFEKEKVAVKLEQHVRAYKAQLDRLPDLWEHCKTQNSEQQTGKGRPIYNADDLDRMDPYKPSGSSVVRDLINEISTMTSSYAHRHATVIGQMYADICDSDYNTAGEMVIPDRLDDIDDITKSLPADGGEEKGAEGSADASQDEGAGKSRKKNQKKKNKKKSKDTVDGEGPTEGNGWQCQQCEMVNPNGSQACNACMSPEKSSESVVVVRSSSSKSRNPANEHQVIYLIDTATKTLPWERAGRDREYTKEEKKTWWTRQRELELEGKALRLEEEALEIEEEKVRVLKASNATEQQWEEAERQTRLAAKAMKAARKEERLKSQQDSLLKKAASLRKEGDALRKVEEDEAKRRKAEASDKKRREEEEAKLRIEEKEAERRKSEEQAKLRKAEEEAQRRKDKEVAQKRKDKENAQREKNRLMRQKKEDREAAEQLAREKSRLERQKKRDREAVERKALEAQWAAEQEVKLKAEREEELRKDRVRKEEEAEQKRRQRRNEEERVNRLKAEEEVQRRKDAERVMLLKAEEEAQRRKDKLLMEEDARRQAEEEALERKAKERARVRKAEEEAQRRKDEEDDAWQMADEEAQRRTDEEQARARAEEKEAQRTFSADIDNTPAHVGNPAAADSFAQTIDDPATAKLCSMLRHAIDATGPAQRALLKEAMKAFGKSGNTHVVANGLMREAMEQWAVVKAQRVPTVASKSTAGGVALAGADTVSAVGAVVLTAGTAATARSIQRIADPAIAEVCNMLKHAILYTGPGQLELLVDATTAFEKSNINHKVARGLMKEACTVLIALQKGVNAGTDAPRDSCSTETKDSEEGQPFPRSKIRTSLENSRAPGTSQDLVDGRAGNSTMKYFGKTDAAYDAFLEENLLPEVEEDMAILEGTTGAVGPGSERKMHSAHKIKGSFAVAGLTEMGKLAGEIEVDFRLAVAQHRQGRWSSSAQSDGGVVELRRRIDSLWQSLGSPSGAIQAVDVAGAVDVDDAGGADGAGGAVGAMGAVRTSTLNDPTKEGEQKTADVTAELCGTLKHALRLKGPGPEEDAPAKGPEFRSMLDAQIQGLVEATTKYGTSGLDDMLGNALQNEAIAKLTILQEAASAVGDGLGFCSPSDINLLFVDDNRTACTMARTIFEQLGFTTAVRQGGVDGLEYVYQDDTAPPNMIVLDLDMPHVSGRSLLKVIKGNPAWRDVPVAIMTATNPTAEDQAELFKLGVCLVGKKPYGADIYVAIVKQSFAFIDAGMTTGQRRLRLLFIDDAAPSCEMAKNLFPPLGFVTDVIRGGIEGLEYVCNDDNAPPHIVVLDLDMPHVNGKSLLRVIKDNKKWKDVPVIITTATDPTEKEQTALFHLGAFSIAVKPITQDTLMQIIIRAVAAAVGQGVGGGEGGGKGGGDGGGGGGDGGDEGGAGGGGAAGGGGEGRGGGSGGAGGDNGGESWSDSDSDSDSLYDDSTDGGGGGGSTDKYGQYV